MDNAFINAKLLQNDTFVTRNIYIREGRIEKISSRRIAAEKRIDIRGKIVLPGLIDEHVHFRMPGFPHKEDWKTGSYAAAAGGVTTVLDMPNTNPPTTSQDSLLLKRECAKKSLIDYGFHFGATNDNIKEIAGARNVAGIKIHMGSTTGSLLTDDPKVIEKAMLAATIPVLVHAEDEALMKLNAEKYKSHHEPFIHNLVRSNEVCARASKLAIHLAGKTTRLHIAHVSTKEELDLLKRAPSNVTAETCPHYLFLNKNDVKRLGNFGKMNPSLKSSIDQAALWQGLKGGRITAIATDHAPHTIEEKQQDYWKAPSGVPGVQTMLPLLLDAVNKRKITLRNLVSLTSKNPARLFRIKGKGMVSPGSDADLVIVDMKRVHSIKDEEQYSKCAWTPYDGMKVKGWPVMTLARGNIIFDGEIIEGHTGSEVTYERSI